MTLSALAKLNKISMRDKEALAMEDPLYWFTEFCFTFDPHDRNTRKPYGNVYYPDRPDYQEALARFIYEIHTNDWLLSPKSRQVRASWTGSGYFLWDALAKPNSYTVFQSRKESDAGWGSEGESRGKGQFEGKKGLALLEKAKIMYDNMPSDFGVEIRCPKKPPKMLLSNGSTLHAMSQDPEGFRSLTATGILADEVAWQEKARRAFTAAYPLLGEGCKYLGLSSVNGRDEFFYPWVHDLEQ